MEKTWRFVLAFTLHTLHTYTHTYFVEKCLCVDTHIKGRCAVVLYRFCCVYVNTPSNVKRHKKSIAYVHNLEYNESLLAFLHYHNGKFRRSGIGARSENSRNEICQGIRRTILFAARLDIAFTTHTWVDHAGDGYCVRIGHW